MSNPKQVGDFANQKQATANLIAHLQTAIAYLKSHEIESPAEVGIVARSLEMVCYNEPLVEADETAENDIFLAPYNAFVGGFAGDFYSFEIEAALGFDRDESNRQKDSIPVVIR
jgi:hypothetical protein